MRSFVGWSLIRPLHPPASIIQKRKPRKTIIIETKEVLHLFRWSTHTHMYMYIYIEINSYIYIQNKETIQTHPKLQHLDPKLLTTQGAAVELVSTVSKAAHVAFGAKSCEPKLQYWEGYSLIFRLNCRFCSWSDTMFTFSGMKLLFSPLQ